MPKQKWKLLKKKVLLNRPHGKLEEWIFALPRGGKKSITMKIGQDFVKVCALTPEKKFVIIRQFYVNVQRKINSLVAGYIDPGEKPGRAAKRELLEETGYKAKKFVYLGKSIKGKYLTGNVYYYLALDAVKAGAQELEEAEDIDVIQIDGGTFKTMVNNTGLADVFAEVCARRALQYLEKI